MTRTRGPSEIRAVRTTTGIPSPVARIVVGLPYTQSFIPRAHRLLALAKTRRLPVTPVGVEDVARAEADEDRERARPPPA